MGADSALPAIVGVLLRATKVNLYEDSVLVKEPSAAEPKPRQFKRRGRRVR